MVNHSWGLNPRTANGLMDVCELHLTEKGWRGQLLICLTEGSPEVCIYVVWKDIEYILYVHMQICMSITKEGLSHSVNVITEIVCPDFVVETGKILVPTFPKQHLVQECNAKISFYIPLNVGGGETTTFCSLSSS